MALDLRRKPASKAKLTLTLIAVLAFMIQPYAGISLSSTVGATDGESSLAPVPVVEGESVVDSKAEDDSSQADQTPEVVPKDDVSGSSSTSVVNPINTTGALDTFVMTSFSTKSSTPVVESVTPTSQSFIGDKQQKIYINISNPEVMKSGFLMLKRANEAGSPLDTPKVNYSLQQDSSGRWHAVVDTAEMTDGAKYLFKVEAHGAEQPWGYYGNNSAWIYPDYYFVVDKTGPNMNDAKINDKSVSVAPRNKNCGPTDFNLVSGNIRLSVSADDQVGIGDVSYQVYKVTSGGCMQSNPDHDYGNGVFGYKSNKLSMSNEGGSKWTGSEFDTASLPEDGSYTVVVTAKDEFGNSTTKYVDIDTDNTAPAAPKINTPDDGYATDDGGFVQSWTEPADDIAIYNYESCRVSFEASGCPDGELQHEISLGDTKRPVGKNAPEGKFWWRVMAVDKAGNQSPWSDARAFTIDRTPPALEVDDLVDDDSISLAGGSYGFTGTAIDSKDGSGVDRVVLNISSLGRSGDVKTFGDNGEWSLDIDQDKLDQLVEGQTYTFSFTVFDEVSNNDVVRYQRVTIDSQAPTVALDSTATGNEVNQPVTVTYGASDNYKFKNYEYKATRDGNPVGTIETGKETISGLTKTYSDHGTYSVTLTAWDDAGNKADKTIKFTIDTQSPAITFGEFTPNFFGDRVSIPVQVSDSFSYTVDGRSSSKTGVAGQPPTWDVTGWKSGWYTMRVTSTDKATNQTVQSAKFYVDHTAPTVNIGSITPEHPGANVPITLTGTAKDDTGVTGLWVSANGGAPEPILFTPGKSVDWTYEFTDGLVLGNYRFTVFAEDGSGELRQASSTSPSMFVGPYSPPAGDTKPEVPAAASSSLVSTVAPEAVIETQDEPATDILGSASTETPIANTAAIAATPQGWKIFGLAWYWIFVMALATIVAAWGLLAARRRRLAAEGVASAPFTRRRG